MLLKNNGPFGNLRLCSGVEFDLLRLILEIFADLKKVTNGKLDWLE
jgi:hypothetical protein